MKAGDLAQGRACLALSGCVCGVVRRGFDTERGGEGGRRVAARNETIMASCGGAL